MSGEIQNKELRRRGHALKPVVLVGDAGPTAAVIAEIGLALAHHELIKIKVRVGDRVQRDRTIDEICAATGAALVQRIGNTALLYLAAADGEDPAAD